MNSPMEKLLPTFRDVVTGTIAKAVHPASLFWWSDGNGSCDCNRMDVFNLDEIMSPEDIAKLEAEWEAGHGTCWGAVRLVVIDVEGDIEDHEKADAIAEMNGCYPASTRPS